MNLSELSNLVDVINHLKNTINSAGVNRFSQDTLQDLRRKLKRFEDQFVDEVIHFEENNQSTSTQIQTALKQAKEELHNEKMVKRRGRPSQEEKPSEVLHEGKTESSDQIDNKDNKSSLYQDSLASELLAKEKQKIQHKIKKTKKD